MSKLIDTITKPFRSLTIMERLKEAENKAVAAESALEAVNKKMASLEKSAPGALIAAGNTPADAAVAQRALPAVATPGALLRHARNLPKTRADSVKHFVALAASGDAAINPDILSRERLELINASFRAPELRNFGLKREDIDAAISRLDAGQPLDREVHKHLQSASSSLVFKMRAESRFAAGYFEVKPEMLDRWRLESLKASLSDDVLRRHHLRRGDFDIALAHLADGSAIDPTLLSRLRSVSVAAGITSEDMELARELMEAGLAVDPKLVHRMRMDALR